MNTIKQLAKQGNTVARSLLKTCDGFNPDQPRDENGRWGEGGGGSSGGSSPEEHGAAAQAATNIASKAPTAANHAAAASAHEKAYNAWSQKSEASRGKDLKAYNRAETERGQHYRLMNGHKEEASRLEKGAQPRESIVKPLGASSGSAGPALFMNMTNNVAPRPSLAERMATVASLHPTAPSRQAAWNASQTAKTKTDHINAHNLHAAVASRFEQKAQAAGAGSPMRGNSLRIASAHRDAANYHAKESHSK